MQSVKSINTTARVVSMSILFQASCILLRLLVSDPRAYRADASQTYDPNDIAMIFATYIPICIYVLISAKGLAIKAISAGAALAATTGIMLSRSRGGVLAMAMIIFVMLLARIPQWKKGVKIATVVILAVIFFYFFSSVEMRFENMEDRLQLDFRRRPASCLGAEPGYFGTTTCLWCRCIVLCHRPWAHASP